MQVGSIIKSFDFPGNIACYMVGEVTAVAGEEITCRTIRQVFDGKAVEMEQLNETFRTMAQGAGMFDQMFDRVVKIG